jgi:hypothetical protein
MKRTSDTGIMFGAAATAGVLLLLGAVVAGAMVGAPVGIAATPGDRSHAAAPNAVSPEDAAAPARAAGGPGRPGAPTGDAGGTLALPITAPSGPLSPQLLEMAAERAPFDPEREAPSGRYLFPEERVVEGPPPEPPRPPDPPFRVVGAVAAGDQSIAVVEPDGQSPKVLRLGEDLLGFRVKSVEGGVVVVSGQGWDLSLPVEALQPVRMGANTRGRGNQRGDDERSSRDQERERDQLRERLEDVEQLRERLENTMRQMQQQTGGEVRMEMDGDRAIITGPNGVRREIRLPGGDGQAGRVIFTPGQRIQVRPGGGQ